MNQCKVRPDINILTSLIQLCIRCKDYKRAFQVLDIIDLFDVKADAFAYTCLIDASNKVSKDRNSLLLVTFFFFPGWRTAACISSVRTDETGRCEAKRCYL